MTATCLWCTCATLLLLLRAGVAARVQSSAVEAEAPGSAAWRGDEALRAAVAHLADDVAEQILGHLRFHYRVASSSACDVATVWGLGGVRYRLRGHKAPVTGTRFFPQGDRVLTWSRDGTAVIWQASSGAPLRTLRHASPVVCAQVFPAGDRIVTRGEDGTAVVWDAATGESASVFDIGGPLPAKGEPSCGLAVLPGGDRVLTWSGGSAAIVRRVSGGGAECELRSPGANVSLAQAFPGGRRVVTADAGGSAVIWDVVACEALHRLSCGHRLTGLAVLPGGGVVATSGHQGTALWSAASGERLRMLATTALRAVDGVAAFPSSDRLLTYNQHGATVWNTTSGAPVRSLTGWPLHTENVAVSPGGDVVTTCGSGWATVWDVASGLVLRDFEEASGLPPRESFRGPLLRTSCSVDVAMGSAVEVEGLGEGLSWRQALRLVW